MTNQPVNLEHILTKEFDELDRRERSVPRFQPGDTIRVNLKVTTGTEVTEFIVEGVCNARFGEGINDRFTIIETRHGVDKKRTFPIYSPVVDRIEVIELDQIHAKNKLNSFENPLLSPKNRLDSFENITQAKKEKNEIIAFITNWAGSTEKAETWYRSQPIAAFGGQTAEGLVTIGKADVVRHYLNSLAAGGFA